MRLVFCLRFELDTIASVEVAEVVGEEFADIVDWDSVVWRPVFCFDYSEIERCKASCMVSGWEKKYVEVAAFSICKCKKVEVAVLGSGSY